MTPITDCYACAGVPGAWHASNCASFDWAADNVAYWLCSLEAWLTLDIPADAYERDLSFHADGIQLALATLSLHLDRLVQS